MAQMADRKLVIQIQPELLLNPNKEQLIGEFVSFLNDLSPFNHCLVSSGDENGAYVNIEVQSKNVQHLWEKIQSALLLKSIDSSVIAKGLVVVCEGDKGWDDYLLLYHYDPSEHVDLFP
jgi:hypothetical protein